MLLTGESLIEPEYSQPYSTPPFVQFGADSVPSKVFCCFSDKYRLNRVKVLYIYRANILKQLCTGTSDLFGFKVYHFFFPHVEDQTPLQEALNQLIRQLQR